ncbi:MAG: metal-dependent hydrolase [Candidatus Hodarchaeales archaeon]
MDPIGHLEWTIGISLILFTIFQIPMDALSFLLLGIGSDFPDIFDWVVYRSKNFQEGHRELSHTFLFIGSLIGISYFLPVVSFLTFGSILHILEDIIAGRDPIFLFSPFTHKGAIQLMTVEQTTTLGGKVRNIIKGSYIGSENIGDELSWLWFLTILGSWFLVIGILMYFT